MFKTMSTPCFLLCYKHKNDLTENNFNPILECFYIYAELKRLRICDSAYKSDYGELRDKCVQFPVTMLKLCRSSDEVKTLLNGLTPDVSKNKAFMGIQMAIDYEQKEFVAHPMVQQALQNAWWSGAPKLVSGGDCHHLPFVGFFLFWFFFWPIASILFIFHCPKALKFMKKPNIKFTTDLASYIYFLAFIGLNTRWYTYNDIRSGDAFSYYEIIIILYLTGMSLRYFKTCYRFGKLCQYFQALFRCSTCCESCKCCKVNNSPQILNFSKDPRIFDMIMISIFGIWFSLRLINWVCYKDTNMQRPQWDNFHVILISESFFALGTVLAFVRLFGLFNGSSVLGPLQIALRHMIYNFFTLSLVFFIFITGFTIAIAKVYSVYNDSERFDQETNETKLHPNVYTNMQKTYKALFWNIFGYGDVQTEGDIVVGNRIDIDKVVLINRSLHTNETFELIHNVQYGDVIKHKFLEGIGYFLLGFFHIIVIVVLINMLIAMMTNSYKQITKNADKEWKFARAMFQMHYFNEVGTLPPPFSINIIGFIIKHLRKCFCEGFKVSNYRPTVYRAEKDKRNFTSLMEELTKRYWRRYPPKNRHNKND